MDCKPKKNVKVKPDINKIVNNARELSMLSFEFEEKREQSLISQSSQMLTAFSIISAVLLMLAPILINSTLIPCQYILICLGITLSLLVVSMVIALFVQWRYKYKALPSPISIYSHMIENLEFFKTEAQRSKSWIETIDLTWQSKHRLNDRRRILITISMIVFFCAIASTLISCFYGYIFYYLR